MNYNNKGFSLIELMVSLVILSIGLLSLASLQGTSVKGNRHGNLVSQATVLAEDRIEEIRNDDYDDVIPANYPLEENFGPNAKFDRDVLIERDVPLPELKRVTVSVTWEDGRNHEIILRTIISDEG